MAEICLGFTEILVHKTQFTEHDNLWLSLGIEPGNLNLVYFWVLTLFPGYWSRVILLERKEMRIFISTNGRKMGFSGDMGDWVG